jgi:hypothetical protein
MPDNSSEHARERRATGSTAAPTDPETLSRLLAVHANATEYYLRQVAGSWVPS